MKKSLLAIAAMTAFAGAAQAQSSVTVYGILDSGLVSTKADTFNGNQVTQSAVQAGGVASTSRLGFKGSEDLGGGTSALFVLETALATAQTSAANSPSPLFGTSATSGNRSSYVGLSNAKLGTGTVGYQYSLTHLTGLAGDPFGGMNLAGQPLVAITLTGMAGSSAVANNAVAVQPGGPAPGAATGSNQDYASRSTAVIYETPNFSGFTAKASYSLNGGASTTNAGVTTPSRNNAAGAALIYNAGKFNATASYVSGVQSLTAYGTPATANDRNIYNTRVAMSYDFGVLKAYATYGMDKIDQVTQSAAQSGQQNVKNTSTQIGVSAIVTPVVSLKGTYSAGKYMLGNSLGGAGFGVDRNQNGFQLGAFYALSKRTDLYTAYGQFTRQNATVTGNNTDSAYALGMRHTF